MEIFNKIDEKKCIDLYNKIKNRNNFAIIAHEDPDGDAISSIYIIAYFLKYLNKSFSLYLKNLPPENYLIAPFKIKLIDSADKINEENIILVDCSNEQRPFIKGLSDKKILINIDHHFDNSRFAEINIVNHEVPSTAEILFEILKIIFKLNSFDKSEIKKFFHIELLNSILLGILYDTYYFNTENTSYNTFRNVAQIIELGGQLHYVKEILFKQKDPVIYKIWGTILNNLKLFKNGKIVLAYIDKKMFEQQINNTINHKVKPSYNLVTEGFINHLSSLKNSELIIFLREHDGFIKGSVRSSSGVAASFANLFEGGGHKNAAGFKIKEDLNNAILLIEKEIENFELN